MRMTCGARYSAPMASAWRPRLGTTRRVCGANARQFSGELRLQLQQQSPQASERPVEFIELGRFGLAPRAASFAQHRAPVGLFPPFEDLGQPAARDAELRDQLVGEARVHALALIGTTSGVAGSGPATIDNSLASHLSSASRFSSS